ncbi:hypothetical protein J2805_004857 [Arthrobacter oryzae]|nr:hypothetical protein [Arthrobacter oryzae]
MVVAAGLTASTALGEEVAAFLMSPKVLRKILRVHPARLPESLCDDGVDGFQAIMGKVGQDDLEPGSWEQRAPLAPAELVFGARPGTVLFYAQDRVIIKRC